MSIIKCYKVKFNYLREILGIYKFFFSDYKSATMNRVIARQRYIHTYIRRQITRKLRAHTHTTTKKKKKKSRGCPQKPNNRKKKNDHRLSHRWWKSGRRRRDPLIPFHLAISPLLLLKKKESLLFRIVERYKCAVSFCGGGDTHTHTQWMAYNFSIFPTKNIYNIISSTLGIFSLDAPAQKNEGSLFLDITNNFFLLL